MPLRRNQAVTALYALEPLWARRIQFEADHGDGGVVGGGGAGRSDPCGRGRFRAGYRPGSQAGGDLKAAGS